MAGRDFTRAKTELESAISAALQAAEADPDPTSGYWASVQVYKVLTAGAGTAARLRARLAYRVREVGQLTVEQLGQKLGIAKATAGMLLLKAREEPEPQPVVAAVIVSGLGVLLSRRIDGTPPWAFVSGEIEPGETAAEAAVREAKEETGLAITPLRELGRRVHPMTHRLMIYMAARPVGSTDVEVGDPAELSELRWLSLDEADELMGGQMYENARAYLRNQLRPERAATA